jgi:uroporphyrinogen decarboxylase
MNISKSLFIKALNKEKLTTPPIWYMRQAGRYMPEYRNIRKKFKNFLDMCKNPEVCCELALQPINAFNLDAAILFSDILTIPDAFGLGVEFIENEGPVLNNSIKTANDINNLIPFNPDELNYVYKAVTNIKNALPSNIPLIGFCGSPWTLAAYSLEGRSSKNFDKTIAFINNNEKEAHLFLSKLTDACFLYLRKQVQAGIDVIQIFDSWANILNADEINNFSFNYIKSLIVALKQDPVTSNTPIILFARDPNVMRIL